MLGSRIYTFTSIFLCVGVVLSTYISQGQFFGTVVHIAKSRSILLVLFNCSVAMGWMLCRAIVKVFFGKLKPAEVQHMESSSIRHGFDLVIALYLLHIDFDWVISSHLALNIGICSMHSLANKRVEYVRFTQLFTERYPRSSYLRMFLLYIILISLDAFIIYQQVDRNLETLWIFFAFEYFLMMIDGLKSFVVFCINLYEKEFRPHGIPNKTSTLSIIDFTFNILKLTATVVEFVILSKRTAFGLYFTYRSFHTIANIWTTLTNFIESRKLLSRVKRFPDATPEEIAEANDVCIFCLDHLEEAKKINCGHLFHYHCLREYFETSSNPKCPTCRADINERAQPAEPAAPQNPRVARQDMASFLLLQDLPEGLPQQLPHEVGGVAWGLPRPVTSHLISKRNEDMRKAVENMNAFLIRFYRNPPEELNSPEEETKVPEGVPTR